MPVSKSDFIAEFLHGFFMIGCALAQAGHWKSLYSIIVTLASLFPFTQSLSVIGAGVPEIFVLEDLDPRYAKPKTKSADPPNIPPHKITRRKIWPARDG